MAERQALLSRRAALRTLCAAAAGASSLSAGANEKALDERDWLGDAGKYLYVTRPTKWVTEVESWREGRVFDTAQLEVYLGDFPATKEARGAAPKTLVKFTEEGIRRGRLILYEGDRAWMYFKGTNQAIRIPLAEQLVGDADVASILNVDLRQGYAVTEVQNDAAAPQVLLVLTARKSELPYASVQLRLDAKTARPIEAQFHSLSGKLVKTVEYLGFQPHAGQQALQGVRIKVHVNARSDHTLIRYAAISSYELPRRYFSPALLKDL